MPKKVSLSPKILRAAKSLDRLKLTEAELVTFRWYGSRYYPDAQVHPEAMPRLMIAAKVKREEIKIEEHEGKLQVMFKKHGVRWITVISAEHWQSLQNVVNAPLIGQKSPAIAVQQVLCLTGPTSKFNG